LGWQGGKTVGYVLQEATTETNFYGLVRQMQVTITVTKFYFGLQTSTFRWKMIQGQSSGCSIENLLLLPVVVVCC